MSTLHTYADGSVLGLMSARTLISIPIWKGNRILDKTHMNAIKASVADPRQLDSGYKLVCYTEPDANGITVTQRYIVDGQHRVSVLKDYFAGELCAADFNVTYTEINVRDEAHAIAYFNKINHAKPIQFKEDPQMIVNRYIAAFGDCWPSRHRILRTAATHRPFMHVERLRCALLAHVDVLTNKSVSWFMDTVKRKNGALLREYELLLASGAESKDVKIIERAQEIGFALAVDPKLRWVTEICV
jgi:hypothetical protein